MGRVIGRAGSATISQAQRVCSWPCRPAAAEDAYGSKRQRTQRVRNSPGPLASPHAAGVLSRGLPVNSNPARAPLFQPLYGSAHPGPTLSHGGAI